MLCYTGINLSSLPALCGGGGSEVRSPALAIFFTPPLLTLSRLLRAQKSAQRYLDIFRSNTTSTVNEFHGGVRSWLPEAPSLFL